MKLILSATFIILTAYLPLQAQVSVKIDNFDGGNIKDSLVLSLYQTFENFKKNYSNSFTIDGDKEFFACYITPKLVYPENSSVMSLMRYDSTKIEILSYSVSDNNLSKKIIPKSDGKYNICLTSFNSLPNIFFRQEWGITRTETQFLFLKREKNKNIFGLFCFDTEPKSGEDKNYPTEKMIKAVTDIFILATE